MKMVNKADYGSGSSFTGVVEIFSKKQQVVSQSDRQLTAKDKMRYHHFEAS